jgi:hypothetical protein
VRLGLFFTKGADSFHARKLDMQDIFHAKAAT